MRIKLRNLLIALSWLSLAMYILGDFYRREAKMIAFQEEFGWSSCTWAWRINPRWATVTIIASFLALFGRFRWMTLVGIPTLAAVGWGIWSSI